MFGSYAAFAQEVEPLPEGPTTDTGVPEETDATSLIPEASDDARPPDYSDWEVEVPAFEEIPLPAEEDVAVPENKEGKALQNRIKFFETRLKAGDDPEVRSEWTRAQTVRTYPEQREAMFNYYTLLYARMRKLAPDLEEMILAQRELDFQRLKQTLIKPSVWPVPPPDFPPPPSPKKKDEDE